MKTDILMMEKKAIFQASLKLIRAGKFQATPLTEIAFIANMSGRMIHCVFDSREKLLAELSQMLTKEIINLIEEASATTDNFERRFFQVWMALYKYYSKNPNVIAFIEQFENINVSHHQQVVHPGNCGALVDLFADAQCEMGSAETVAAIFHSNVLSASKMRTMPDFNDVKFKPELLSQLLWNGMFCPEKRIRATHDLARL
jgi:TetR/AcrR family transcriptional regulator, multidrug resistance operon repressor